MGGPIRQLAVAIALCILATVVGPAQPADAQAAGFSIRAGRLIDANGTDFVMRGVNHPHAWFPGQVDSLRAIKATGANTVRIVLSTGAQFRRTPESEIRTIVDECQKTQLVCVLEIHDTTGFAERPGAISLEAAVQYWTDLQPALAGYEAFIILNLGNEPFGNVSYLDWTESTTAAIEQMRSAGFTHTLMVDAPNWGQDWSLTMSSNAQHVLDTDPDHNVIFDVHMYGVYDDETAVRTYIESFVRRELPLVIGEFGATHTDGNPDEDAIMRWAQTYGIGYLAWSWSGNNSPVEGLNLVTDFDAEAPTGWGDRLIHGDNGIASTAHEASVYGGPPAPPRVLPRPPALAAGANASDVRVITRSEAEDGVHNGLRESVKGAGFSGWGYVNGFRAPGDAAHLPVHMTSAGTYDLVIGFRTSFGDKVQTLYVNGAWTGRIRFPASDDFTTVTFPGVKLTEGANTITIAHDWGWFDLDYVEVRSRTG